MLYLLVTHICFFLWLRSLILYRICSAMGIVAVLEQPKHHSTGGLAGLPHFKSLVRNIPDSWIFNKVISTTQTNHKDQPPRHSIHSMCDCSHSGVSHLYMYGLVRHWNREANAPLCQPCVFWGSGMCLLSYHTQNLDWCNRHWWLSENRQEAHQPQLQSQRKPLWKKKRPVGVFFLHQTTMFKIDIYIYINTCIYLCLHIYTYTYIHKYTCICIYIYI